MLHDSPGTLDLFDIRMVSHPIKAPNTHGIGKICVFQSVDKSPGSDISLPKICIHPPNYTFQPFLQGHIDLFSLQCFVR